MIRVRVAGGGTAEGTYYFYFNNWGNCPVSLLRSKFITLLNPMFRTLMASTTALNSRHADWFILLNRAPRQCGWIATHSWTSLPWAVLLFLHVWVACPRLALLRVSAQPNNC
jgi:hypothetical protein